MNPIRIGLIGVGRAGWQMHTRELEPYGELFTFVAACDLIRERRDRMHEKYQATPYRRAEDLIADPRVELVDVASRTTDHLTHAKGALEAGKFVFLEKPIGANWAEVRQLQALSVRYPRKLFIRHNRRFEPAFQHVREIIDSGLLGSVHAITLRRGVYQRRDDWQTLRRCGGGQLLNWGPHIIDHALRFLKTPPVSIFSHLQQVAAAGDAEDLVRILLRNREGMIVDLEISGARVQPEPEIRVCGKKGSLTCTGETIQLRYLRPDVKRAPRRAKAGTPAEGFGSPDQLEWVEEEIPVHPKLTSGTALIWKHLYESIRNRKPFPITMREAVEVMRIVHRAKKGTPYED
ncbi:MAG: Gfo/Idh/MocA family oxidoreductase [Kiritimatiellia bacterium]|nr:Gfo/Idh/MocA family oxidoreductase [Kiritimatiellia bacterium]